MPVEVLVLTADAAIPTAVEAIKLGAYDYLVKPVDLEHLSKVIGQAFEKRSCSGTRISCSRPPSSAKRTGSR